MTVISGCPIRIFTGQGLFAPNRDFSQLITSFIASESLGIHRTPLLTLFKNGIVMHLLVFVLFYFFTLSNMSKIAYFIFLSKNRIDSFHSSILLFVENNGFEPLTPCVQGRCSSQLS